jgi:hypothetical protein
MNARDRQIRAELHIIIHALLIELGYPISEDLLGLCGAFSDSIRKAFHNGQLSKCNEIIAYIDNELKYADLTKIRIRLKSQSRYAETEEDQIMIDTLDFFDQIAYQQTKSNSSRLFCQPSELKQSIYNDAGSMKKELPSISNYEELYLYLKHLYDRIPTLDINLSIAIGGSYVPDSYGYHLFIGHAIEICYDHLTKNWVLADINQLPIQEKPASFENICGFVTDAMSVMPDKKLELFHVALSSSSQHKELLQQMSKNVKDNVKLSAPSDSTAGLDTFQINLLQELSKEGLKANHLRKWRSSNGSYFTEVHSEAFKYLIKKENPLSFEDAIEEISDVDRHQVEGITRGLKKQDVIGLDTFQILALEDLAKYKLTSDHLRSWKSNATDHFTHVHFDALKFLLEKGMQPDTAMSKLKGLNADQAESIAWYNRWPDGTQIQITLTSTGVDTSFPMFNTLDSKQAYSDGNATSQPPLKQTKLFFG